MSTVAEPTSPAPTAGAPSSAPAAPPAVTGAGEQPKVAATGGAEAGHAAKPAGAEQPSSALPLAPGTEVKFKTISVNVESTLRSGGMANVYVAVDEKKKKYALKELDLARVLEGADVARERFRRECDIAMKLQHESIVRTVAAAHDRERPLVLMDFLPGKTLTDFVKVHGPLPEEEVLAIGAQIADALAYWTKQPQRTRHAGSMRITFVPMHRK